MNIESGRPFKVMAWIGNENEENITANIRVSLFGTWEYLCTRKLSTQLEDYRLKVIVKSNRKQVSSKLPNEEPLEK